MGPSAELTGQAWLLGQSDRRGPPTLPSRDHWTRESPGVGPPRGSSGKTNPFEPIQVKSRRFKEMSEILINRTHSSYFTCFQTVTAKLRPISGSYVPSRTRIRVLRAQGRKALSLYLSLDTPIAGGPRAVSGHTGREKRRQIRTKSSKKQSQEVFCCQQIVPRMGQNKANGDSVVGGFKQPSDSTSMPYTWRSRLGTSTLNRRFPLLLRSGAHRRESTSTEI